MWHQMNHLEIGVNQQIIHSSGFFIHELPVSEFSQGRVFSKSGEPKCMVNVTGSGRGQTWIFTPLYLFATAVFPLTRGITSSLSSCLFGVLFSRYFSCRYWGKEWGKQPQILEELSKPSCLSDFIMFRALQGVVIPWFLAETGHSGLPC